MKKKYFGLDAIYITLDVDIICSSGCSSVVTLENEGGVCVTPEAERIIKWYGNKS